LGLQELPSTDSHVGVEPQLLMHAPPEQVWPEGHETGGLVQPCVSVELEPEHEPPEHA
jgi:hypothetical protein